MARAVSFFVLAALLVLYTLAADTKHFTTKDGTRYVYDYAPPQSNNSTVLLVHGYPSSRYDWRHQVADLSAAGYGVLAPDCLGYGDSDHPLEIEAYHAKRLSGHLDEILDSENLSTVVGVGHDWGTSVLSKTVVWYPQRFEKVAFLSTGYTAPGFFFDLDAFNTLSLQQHGYHQYGYWYFFNSYNAAELLADHLESMFHMVFPFNNSAWIENMADLGAARAWLTANKTTQLPAFMTQADKDHWLATYSRDHAIKASVNYYQAVMRGLQVEDEAVLTDDDRKLRVPVLTIGGTQDVVSPPDQIAPTTQPWATAGYTAKTVDAGHWMMMEQREAVSAILLEFAAY